MKTALLLTVVVAAGAVTYEAGLRDGCLAAKEGYRIASTATEPYVRGWALGYMECTENPEAKPWDR